MFIEKEGAFYRASRVTGPTHNVLELRFVDAAQEAGATPGVEALPPVGPGRHEPLGPETVLRAAVGGVEEANRDFGAGLRVALVRYASDDTPPERAYGTTAYAVAGKIARDETQEPGGKR